MAVFSAPQLNFGTVPVGSSSTLTLTVTNQSPTKMKVKGISFSGTAYLEYTQTNNCSGKLLPFASCTVSVKFTPTATGTQNAFLNFADSAAGPTRKIALFAVGN